MRAYYWMRKLLKFGKPRQSIHQPHCRANSLVPRLSIKRLEERRVLNADAAPVDVLVVDAGEAANDGQADTFQVEQDSDDMRVTVNGQDALTASLGSVAEIHVHGSADKDVLVADLTAGLRLVFDGGGGDDHFHAQSVDDHEYVGYELNGADGQIGARSASGTSTIEFHSVERVTDPLDTAVRDFNFAGTGHDITLSGTNAVESPSLLTVDGEHGLSVEFTHPTESLRIDTSAHGQARPDRFAVENLDGGFDADLFITGSESDAFLLKGDTNLGSGDLNVSTGSIVLAGSLTSAGADFDLAAEESISLEDSAVLSNEGGLVHVAGPTIELNGGIATRGGVVILDSGEKGTTNMQGWIDVSQAAIDQQGGVVHVLGGTVGMLAAARIDASGGAGGGTVLVGGDFQGKNANVRNATHTYVGSHASILADADAKGDGGKVVVWADDVARFHGRISARGGSDGGSGGFVETSGRNYLYAAGSVNASAPAGAGGIWLLDPRDVDLVQLTDNGTDDSTDGSFDGGAPNTFVPDNDADAVIAQADIFEIEDSLEAGTNVVITTTSVAGTGNGDITVVDAINVDLSANAGAQAVTLSLNADRDIIVDNTITLIATDDISDQLSLTLTAAGDVSINSAIDLDAGGTGGVFTSTGVNFDNSVTGAGMITTGSGAVTINHSGSVAIDASITTSGALDVDSGASITDGAGAVITVAGNADLNANAGASDITLNNAAAHAFGSLTFSGAGVTIAESDATVLSGTSTANTLNLSSGGSITDDGTADLTVTNNASFTANAGADAISLDDTYAFGSLTFSGAGVTIVESDATVLSGTSTADTLNLSSGGSITDDGTADLTVTNNASFTANAGADAISLDDTYAFGSLTFVGAAVTIVESNSTVLSGTSTADTLNLSSGGSITDDGTADLTVTNNASFTANAGADAITLDDTYAFGSLTFVGAAVTIVESNSTVLSGTSTASSLDLSSVDSITDSPAASLTVTALADLAATAIMLGDAAATIDFGQLAALASMGDIRVNEINGMQLSAISAPAGDVDIVVVGNMTTTGGMDVTSQNVTLTLAADQTLSVDANTSITATANATLIADKMTLASAGGDLISAGAAATLSLQAAQSGTNLRLGANAGADSDAGSGTLALDATDLAALNDVSGTIQFGAASSRGESTIDNAAATLTINAPLSFFATTFTFTADGDALATDATLSIDATQAITDAAGDDTTVDLTATTLTISDATTIGTSQTDALNLSIDTLVVNASDGDAFFTEASGVDLGTINVSSNDDLFLRALAGNLTDANDDSNVVADDLTLQVDAAGAAIGASGAATDVNITLGGSLTALATSGGGGVFVSETGDLDLNVANAGTGIVELTATAAIFDASAGEGAGNENVVGATANLNAGSGIGSTVDHLNTSIDSLQAASMASGGVFVQETNALVINGLGVRTLGGDGDISVDVDAGNLTNDSMVTADGGGTVTLNADAGAVDVNAVVSSTTGALAVAGDLVTQDANITTGGSGAVIVDADTASIVMADGAVTTSTTGEITYQAATDVALSQLETGGDVGVTATAGAITDNTAANGAGNENAAGGTVTLTAATGVGSGAGDLDELAAIDIDAAVLNVMNVSSGEVQIRESNSVALGVVSNPNRFVILDAAGVITDGNAGGLNVSASDTVVRAQDGIGSVADAIDTNVARLEAAGGTGGLFVTNQGALEIADVSGVLQGAAAVGNVMINTTAGNLVASQPIESTGQSVDLAAGSNLQLNATVTGSQNVSATAVNDVTVMQPVTAMMQSVSLSAGNDTVLNESVTGQQNVSATAGNDLMVMAPVTAMDQAVTLNADNAVRIDASVDARNTVDGMIRVAAGADAFAGGDEIALALARIQSLQIMAGGSLNSGGGSISNVLDFLDIAGVGPRYSGLDMSDIDPASMPLTTGSTATINVQIAESTPMELRSIQIEVDWRESMGTVMMTGAFPDGVVAELVPPADTMARIVQTVVERDAADGLPLETVLEHVYFANPDGISSPFLFVPLRVSQFAGGMINLEVGGFNVVDLPLPMGTLRDNLGMTVDLDMDQIPDSQIGIMSVLRLEVLEFPIGDALPLPEALPVLPPAAPLLMPIAPPAADVAQIAEATTFPNTPGLTGQAELRYYELRIVSFDQDGELVESPEERINLSDPRLDAIAPFNPSKLPELFKRLPGDRYRIYLIEDSAERLMIEFVIQRVGDEGRPIELPERIEADAQEEGDNGEPVGESKLGVPLERPEMPPAKNGRQDDNPPFAETLARASFVSSGGVIFGAAMFSKSARQRREARADRRMAAFRNRRRSRCRSYRMGSAPTRRTGQPSTEL